MHATDKVVAALLVCAISGAANAETPALLDQKPASAATLEVLARPLPPSLDDRRDFDFADRGFIAAIPAIKDQDGKILKDLNAYRWAARTTPDTVNPSLLRATALSAKNGLFRVTDGVYQVRGFDANMTIVKTAAG